MNYSCLYIFIFIDPFVGEAKQDRGEFHTFFQRNPVEYFSEILPTENYIEWQKGLVRCQSFSAISLFAALCLVREPLSSHQTKLLFKANCPLCFKKVYESEKYLSCSSCGESFHWFTFVICYFAVQFKASIFRRCVPSRKSDKNSAWKCADCKDSYDIPLRETTSPENQRGAGKRINRRRIDC